jgi:hypothetical protein
MFSRFGAYTEEKEEKESINHTNPSRDFHPVKGSGIAFKRSSLNNFNMSPIVNSFPTWPRGKVDLSPYRAVPYIERDGNGHIYSTEHE